jgi:hypothetical protein
MPIEILTSTQDDFGYYDNLGYLRKALQEGRVHFEGLVNNYAHDEPPFATARIYDFSRSANSSIRENMTTYLSRNNVLPGIQPQDHQKIRVAFNCLFNYFAYKGYLDQVHQQRHESMYMMIFNQPQQYVAHVGFSSTSRRTAQEQFTVDAILTCQRFTYFPKQETDFEDVLQALQNLHVHDE